MDQLFSITDYVLATGTDEEIYYTWRWVTTGYIHSSVRHEFMEAWRVANVLVWIDHRNYYKDKFEKISKNFIDIV